MREDEPKSHVFLKPCGCLVCVIVNVPQMFGELAKAQRYAQKHSEIYKFMETQAVREMAWKCPQHKRVSPKDKGGKVRRDKMRKIKSYPNLSTSNGQVFCLVYASVKEMLNVGYVPCITTSNDGDNGIYWIK